VIASAVIFVGAGLSADLLWGVADIMMGGMTLINMPVILYLGKYAVRALKDYERQLKAGGEITFRTKNIDLPHETDYWN
jgi:AGCS family alanine or glycine:cation symporter